MYNSVLSNRITSLYGSPPSSVVLIAKQRLLGQNYKSLLVPVVTCRFVHANQRLWPRITSLYGYKTSPVALCMHNSAFWNRITSLYGFQPSSVVLCVENSDFRTKIAHLYGSKTSPVILCMQNSVPSIRITSLYRSQPSSVCFFHSKQRLYDQTYKCVWVPDLI